MTDPTDFTDSTSASNSEQKSSGNTGNIVVWVILGIGGCGCFVLVLGFLAAIALPSFLNQAGRAREAEGRVNVGALMRAQQGYILETGQFSESIAELEMGLSDESEFYRYQIRPREDQVEIVGIAKEEGFKRDLKATLPLWLYKRMVAC